MIVDDSALAKIEQPRGHRRSGAEKRKIVEAMPPGVSGAAMARQYGSTPISVHLFSSGPILMHANLSLRFLPGVQKGTIHRSVVSHRLSCMKRRGGGRCDLVGGSAAHSIRRQTGRVSGKAGKARDQQLRDSRCGSRDPSPSLKSAKKQSSA